MKVGKRSLNIFWFLFLGSLRSLVFGLGPWGGLDRCRCWGLLVVLSLGLALGILGLRAT
jgi:hypothetical protein